MSQEAVALQDEGLAIEPFDSDDMMEFKAMQEQLAIVDNLIQDMEMGVSNAEVVALEAICPGVIMSNWPQGGFSLNKSKTNLKVAIEAAEEAKKGVIRRMIDWIVAKFKAFIKWVGQKLGLVSKAAPEQVKELKESVAQLNDVVSKASKVDLAAVSKLGDEYHEKLMNVLANQYYREVVLRKGGLAQELDDVLDQVGNAIDNITTISDAIDANTYARKAQRMHPSKVKVGMTDSFADILKATHTYCNDLSARMREASQTISNEKAGEGPLTPVLTRTIAELDASVQQYFTKSDMDSFGTLYQTALKKFEDHVDKLSGIDQKEAKAFSDYATFVLSMSHALVSILAYNATCILAQIKFVGQLTIDYNRELDVILKKADEK